MARTAQYTIGFNADTSQAKKALQDLNTQLDRLKANAESDLGISSDLSEAARAADLLQENLSKAFNQNTGKWNFSDLNKSLQNSGTSVTELSRKFLNCGATGQSAFLALSRAISTMEIPITKTTTMLDKMVTTLKNTVKWELSSTFVHSLESGLSSAISYAKNLNSSLSDIRIVTGYSADAMTEFAIQANKAAKQLSTTTKAYADASLIYFQQGDAAETVAKKAAITTKAANVAFSASAEEMSEMLTAVWNSYQVGENELERYVDIMAALGAATATSTEEIATAMQKVAATANTVGVSMEQMSSIIATVSSVTREAPESIGTSFKTILARIGDLKIGETLDDGMSLGTVSSQLAAVGVNILDTTGELRDMGDVIEELMSKWEGMTSAEKTAVAQAVAGKRQYTQLMALMENQDMYKKSMGIAESAEGTLQSQADIYAESWEAASKQVKASLEGIYQNLIPEKGLISATKTMSKVLDVVNEMIKGFGGLSGIVVQVGSALTMAFSNKIAASITSMLSKVGQFAKSFNMTDQNGKSIGFGAKVKSFFTETTDQRKYKQSNIKIQSQISEALSNPAISNSTKEALTATDTLLQKRMEFLAVEKNMSAEQKAAAESYLDGLSRQVEKINQLKSEQTSYNAELDKQKKALRDIGNLSEAKNSSGAYKKIKNATSVQELQKERNLQAKSLFEGTNSDNKQFSAISQNELFKGQQLDTSKYQQSTQYLDALIDRMAKLEGATQQLAHAKANFESFVNVDTGEAKSAVQELELSLTTLKTSLSEKGMDTSAIDALIEKFNKIKESGQIGNVGAFDEIIAELDRLENVAHGGVASAMDYLSEKLAMPRDKLEALAQQADLTEDQINALALAVRRYGEESQRSMSISPLQKGMQAAVQSISAATASFSSFSNLVSNWDESSVTSKITSIAGAATNVVNAFMTGGIAAGVASIVGSAIGALVGQMEQAEKLAQELEQERTERLNESIDNNQESNLALQNLISQFNDLYNIKNRTSDEDARLASLASQLANEYDITGIAVQNLTGDYEELIEKLQQIANGDFGNEEDVFSTAEKNYETARERLASNSALHVGSSTASGQAGTYFSTGKQKEEFLNLEGYKNVANMTAKGYGGIALDSNYLDKYGIPYGITRTDDTGAILVDAYHLNNSKSDTVFKGKDGYNLSSGLTYLDLISQMDMEDIFFSEDEGNKDLDLLISDYDSADYRYSVYKNLIKLRDKMDALGISTEDNFYQQISGVINTLSEEMTSYEEALKVFGEAKITEESNRYIGKQAGENGYDFNDFWSDYEITLDNFKTHLRTTNPGLSEEEIAQMAMDSTQAVLGMNSGLTPYSSALQSAYDVYDDLNSAQGALTSLESEGFNLEDVNYGIIQAYKQNNTDYIDAMLDNKQKQQIYNNAVDTYNGAQEAVSLLKEDMSFEEMGKLYDAIDWGSGDIIAWNDFYEMSYEDKQNYLQSLSDDYLETSKEAAVNARKAAEAEQTAAEQAKDTFGEEYHSEIVAAAEEDILNDQKYATYLSKKVKNDQGSWETKNDVTLTKEENIIENDYNEWLKEENNKGKDLTDFITEKQSQGARGISQADIDEYNRLVAEAEAAGAAVDDALRNEMLWEAMGSQVDSVTTKVQRLANAITELPTDSKELKKVADALGWNMGQLVDSTAAERAAQAAKVVEKPTLKQSGTRMVYQDGPVVLSLGKNYSTDQDYADYAAETAAYQDFFAQDASYRIQAIGDKNIKTLADLEQMESILSDINIEELPIKGTKAYEQLNKALEKVNTKMTDFKKLSKADQLSTIAKAKNAVLKEQMDINKQYQDIYSEIMEDNTGKYSEEYKLEATQNYYDTVIEYNNMVLQQEQNIADARQQALEIYKQEIDMAKARQSTLQEEAEKMQKLAQVMTDAAATGALSEEDKALFTKDQLDSWENATNASERGKLAADMWAQSVEKIQTSGEELSSSYEKAWIGLGWASRLTLFGRSLDISKQEDYLEYLRRLGITDEEVLGSVATAWDNLEAKGSFDPSTLSVQEIGKALQQELELMGTDLAEATNIAMAQAKDVIFGIYSSLGEKEQELAQNVVDTWESAFKQIAALRSKILMGESIGEDLTSSFDSFLLYANQYNGNMTDMVNAYRSGTLEADQFSYGTPDDYADKLKNSNGLQYFDFDNGNFDFSKVQNAFGIDRENFNTDEEFDKATRKAVSGYLRNLLSDKNVSELSEGTFSDADSLIASYENGDSNSSTALEIIAQLMSEVNEGAGLFAQVVEDEQKISEAQDERDHTMQQNQEKAEQAAANATGANSALSYKRGDSTVTEALSSSGVDLFSFAKRANEILGRDDLTADNLDLLDDYDLNEIVSAETAAAEEFHGIVVNAAEKFAAIFTVNGKFSNYTGSTYDEEAQNTVEEANNAAASFNQNAINIDTIASDMATSVGMSKQEFTDFAESLYYASGAIEDFNSLAPELKREMLEMARKTKNAEDGFESLQSTSEDTWKILKKETKASVAEYSKALTGMKQNMAKIFNTDIAKISNEFVENHLEQMEKMAEGTEEEAMAAQDAIEDDLVAELLKANGIEPTVTINIDGVDQTIDILDMFQNQFDQWDGQEVGFTVDADTVPAINNMNDLLAAGTMTAEQITAALNSIGWEPNIRWEEIQLTDSQVGQEYATVTDSTGKSHTVRVTEEMRSSKTVKIPVIGSASKISAPGGGGRKKSSGGGGGGGEPKKIDKKDPEDEKERYHHINKVLDRLSDQLDEVDKKKSRVYGKGYLDYLSQEIALTEKECDAYQRYIDEAKEYLALDTQRVASLGATFDEFGNIENYDEVMDNVIGKYNEFVDRYNAMSASEQEAAEEEKTEWDEWYDEKKKWIENYEDTVATIYEQQNNLLEAQNKISEKTLEGIQYKVEIHVDMTDAEKDFLDYLNDAYDELLEKQGDVMNNLVRETELAVSNLDALGQSKEELDAAFASGKLNQADYVEGLKDVNEQILDNLGNIQDLKKEIEELYGDTLEMASEAFDEQTEKIKNASEAMSSYISILGLIGKGSNLKDLTKFYESQYEYNLQSLEMQKEYLDILRSEEEYYLERMNSAEGLTETERQQYEDLEQTIADVNSNILSDTESTLNQIAEAFNNEIEIIFKDLEERIAGVGNSIQDLADAYSYYQEEQSRYVTSARELYEVNKLNRQIEKTMNETSSKVNKNLLAALQDRINKQSELNELTEYDIEMNQLQYELLLKKIALEEAQNAKSTVRLTRDSGGNYVYQYTADQDDIATKQQEYEDVLQQINNLSVDRVQNLESQLLEIYQNTLSKIKEIAQDQTLTEEEKYDKIQTIMDQFKEQTNFIQEQYQIASDNLITSNLAISEHYGQQLVEHSENAKNGLNQTIAAMIADTESLQQALEEACANQIPAAMDTMQSRIDAVTAAVNLDYNSMSESVNIYNKVTKDAQDQTNKTADSLSEELLPAIHSATNAWDAYADKLKNVISTYESMYQAILKTIQAQAQLSNATAPSTVKSSGSGKFTDTTTPSANNNTVSGSGGGGGDGASGSSSYGSTQYTTISYKVLTAAGGAQGQAVGGSPSGPKKLAVGSTGTLSHNPDDGFIKAGWSISDPSKLSISGDTMTALAAGSVTVTVKYWDRRSSTATTAASTSGGNGGGLKYQIAMKYATGGLADFTGPAWLDGTKSKPEIVLNPQDTENILTAVQGVRALDSSTLSMLNKYITNASLAMSFGLGNISAGSVYGATDTIQQEVHITAEFPNATNSAEIQDAFDNIINRATQYITTKK